MRIPGLIIGLLDYPGGRKRHAAVVPLTGGPAMLLLYLLFQVLRSGRYEGLLTGALLLALTGFVDDLHGVPVWTRLMVEALVVTLLNVWGT